jgi:hypothetical protein
MNRAQRRHPQGFTRHKTGLFVPGNYAEREEHVEFTRVVMNREAYGQLLSERGQRGMAHLLADIEDAVSGDVPADVKARARAENDKMVVVDAPGDQIAFMQIVG